MVISPLQKKIFYILSSILLVILLIVITALVSITVYFNNNFKEKIQTEVYKQTKGEYELKIKKLSVNVFNQSFRLNECSLTPDKSIKPDNAKYKVTVKQINLKDFGLWGFLIKKKLDLDNLEMVEPVVNIYRNIPVKQKTKTDSSEKISIYTILKKFISEISIDKICITNASVHVFDHMSDKQNLLTSNSNELFITHFKINKISDEQNKLFIADVLKLTVNNFIYHSAKNLNTLYIKKITASYNDSILILDSFQLKPNYNKHVYAKKVGHQTDRITIHTLESTFHNIDISSLFEKNILIAKHLNVKNFNIEIYRDKNDPPLEIKYAKSLQQKLKTIPILMNINKITLKNSKVVYEEVAKDADKAGSISFDQLNGTVTGLTSNPVLYGCKKLDVQATALFMNTGKLKARFTFPLTTDEMVFVCYGKLGEMDLKVLNKILTPNAHLVIKDGIADSALISFHADNSGALGTLKIGYHHLKINLLKKDNGKGFYSGFLSLLYRILFIKEENPTRKKDIRIAEINYKRDPKHFIFKYTWMSILSGIKPTIGIPHARSKKKPKEN